MDVVPGSTAFTPLGEQETGRTRLSFLLSLIGYFTASCSSRDSISLCSMSSAASFWDRLSVPALTSGPKVRDTGRGRPRCSTCTETGYHRSERTAGTHSLPQESAEQSSIATPSRLKADPHRAAADRMLQQVPKKGFTCAKSTIRSVQEACRGQSCKAPESAASAQLLPAPWRQPAFWLSHLQHPPPSLCHPCLPPLASAGHILNQLNAAWSGSSIALNYVTETFGTQRDSLLHTRTFLPAHRCPS